MIAVARLLLPSRAALMFTLLAAVMIMGPASSASAGTYEVRSCANGNNNAGWTAHNVTSGTTAFTCPSPGMTANTLTAGPIKAARWTFAAPAQTTITNARGQWQYRTQGTQGVAFLAATNAATPAGQTTSTSTAIAGYSTFAGSSRDTGVVAHNVAVPGTSHLIFESAGGPNANGGLITVQDVYVRISDSTAPSISAQAGWTTNAWARGSQAVSFTAQDASIGIKQTKVIVDPTASTPITAMTSDKSCDYSFKAPCPTAAQTAQSATINTATLSDGTHTLRLQATDTADNVTNADTTVRVDNTAPSVALDRSVGSQSPALSWNVTDATSGVTTVSGDYRISGGAWTPLTLTHSPAAGTATASLPAGMQAASVEVRLTATDAAGTPTTRTDTIAVDSKAPTAVFSAGSAGSLTNDSTPTFTWSADESSTFTCKVDSGTFSACSSPYTAQTLADGAHTFTVRPADSAGNVGADIVQSFTVDATAPTVTLSGPSSPTSNASPSFTFTASEAGSTFQCKLDSGAWASCTSPKGFSGLSDGDHVIAVRAIDPAGNTGAESTRTLTVDTTAPQTTLVSGPTGPTNVVRPRYELSSDASGATFQYRLDGGSWAGFTGASTTLPTLAEGAHTIEFRATDPAGNVDASPVSVSITVDLTAPTSTLTGPSGLIKDASPAYTFTASETGSTFQCKLDTGSWASCTSPRTFSALAEGAHTIEVRAIDAAGNTGAAASRTITVDTQGPATSLTGPSGLTRDAAPSYTFTAEANATFECKLDTGAWATCSSPRTLSALTDGEHTFSVRATDQAGNTGAAASRTVTVDTQGPATSLTGPSGLTKNASPSYSFTAEAGASFECKLDTGAWASCTSPRALSSLSDGEHTFSVRATDQAGNTGAVASRTVTVDTQGPATNLTGPTGLTKNASPAYSFTAEANATFECKLDTGAWASCASPRTLSSLTDGEHTFSVRATDQVGNTGAASSRTVIVDTQGPATTLTGPSGLTKDASPSYTFAAEAGASFECRLDSGSWAACTSPKGFSALADGEHVISVRATDAAGNTGAAASRTVTVDTQGPATTLTGPTGLTKDASPTYSFSSESGASFECRLDTGAWATCSSPRALSSLADGEHTFSVRATDAAGNTGAAASRTVTVDTQGPATSLTGPTGLTKNASPSYSFTAEANATFECKLDAGTWASCSSPRALSSLADGEHTFSVRATDAAGNTGAAASRTVTVDTQGPATTLTGPTGLTKDASPTYSFTAEAGASFECRLDSGAWATCTSAKSFSGLADGEHTVSVRAIDQAGNTGAAVSRTITVDTHGPASELTGPSGLTKDASPSYTFTAEAGASFECQLNSGAWATCSSPRALSSLTDGEHTFSVRATDQAGNTGAVASRTVIVDTRAPDLQVDPVADEIDDDTPQVTFTAEAGATVDCRVDDGEWATCTSPATFGPLSDGRHSVSVRAADQAGNVAATQTRTFTVDTRAPATTKVDGPQAQVDTDEVTFAFSSEAEATFQCRVDDGTWTVCDSPQTISDLTDGEHRFSVRARDRAGNVESSPVTWTFTVDTAAPQLVRGDGPSGTVSDVNPQITFSSADADRFECRVDNDPWQACTSPWRAVRSAEGSAARSSAGLRAAAEPLAPLSPGQHTAQVRAIDAAGNVSSVETWTFTVLAGTADMTDIRAHIGEELSISAGTADRMQLTHDADAQSATRVDVTSTALSWTLAVHDNDVQTPGHMDGSRTSLVEPLRFGSDAADLTAITGTAQQLSSGQLVDDRPLLFAQALDADEDVFAGEQYQLTAVISATAP